MMIGIVIVTHGKLAQEFKTSVEHILGMPQPSFLTLSLEKEDNIHQKHQVLTEMIHELNQGEGVVVLTDMFGGIASNLALSLLALDHVEVLAGINLPMLIKLISVREKKTLQEALKEAQEAGKHYINVASHFLSAGNG